jgi:hypothetical protein
MQPIGFGGLLSNRIPLKGQIHGLEITFLSQDEK